MNERKEKPGYLTFSFFPLKQWCVKVDPDDTVRADFGAKGHEYTAAQFHNKTISCPFQDERKTLWLKQLRTYRTRRTERSAAGDDDDDDQRA